MLITVSLINLLTVSFTEGPLAATQIGVIIPARRSTAFSYFMMISHTFGDASGPYLIGVISDAIRHGKESSEDQYWALVKASSITVALLVVSAFFYYLTAFFLVRDQKIYRREMGMGQEEMPRPDSCNSVEKLKNHREVDNQSVESESSMERF